MAVLGLTESSLSTAIANDRFTAKDLVAIADHIGVPVADLFAEGESFLAVVKENGETHTFTSRARLGEWLGR